MVCAEWATNRLEVQHPARPWHTVALGAGLVAYLVAPHLAESGAGPARVLRRQAKLLAVGACLLALGAGFALLPAAAPGTGAALLRVLAAAAVIAAAVLVLPPEILAGEPGNLPAASASLRVCNYPWKRFRPAWRPGSASRRFTRRTPWPW